VHAFATKPSVWGRLAAYKEGVPVIVGTVPGLGNLYTLNDARTRAGRRVYEWLQRKACSRSDLTVFQNQDDYHRFTGSGICPPEKAEIVLGSGVRTAELDRERMPSSVREGFRAEIEADEDAVVVTMISRITKSKGVLDFAAAAGLCDPESRIRFVLVGPDDRHSLDRLDERELAGIRETLTWLGPRSDVPAILAGSDVCVLPSYYREGIPRVLLEAASMALPLVAADGPGAREVVIPHRNGLLVPAKDPRALASAIGFIAADPNLRRNFASESRRMAVDKFDIRVVARATRTQYERLLAEADAGGPAHAHGDRTNSQGAA
jgi:glycosyltransferase involved in cell wall biosynthesis